MTVTWRLNRSLAFGRSETARIEEWLRYISVNSLGACVNYALYAVAILLIPAIGTTTAIAAGSLVGLIFNYTLSDRLVFVSKNEVDSPAAR